MTGTGVAKSPRPQKVLRVPEPAGSISALVQPGSIKYMAVKEGFQENALCCAINMLPCDVYRHTHRHSAALCFRKVQALNTTFPHEKAVWITLAF